MANAVFGQVKLNVDAYKEFLFSEAYLYPTRDKGIYRASELIPFFESSGKELEKLLSQVPLDGKPIVVCSNEVILHEYTLVGHGNTGTNKDGNITGWSGDMLCTSWKEKVKRNGVEVEVEIPGGLEQARDHSREIKPGNFSLCFVSDLPRAIHHALMLHGNQNLEKHLESFSHKISNEIERMGNIVDRQIYRDLISLTLENGFIPAPFLRSHYYGPLELHPAKLDESDREKWIGSAVAKAEASGIDGKRALKEAEELADALIRRKELLFAPRNDDGNVLTENRVDLVKRIASFYDSVNKVSMGRRVLVVGSTGCFDASKAYFRYFGQRDRRLMVENDPTERGRVLNAKLGNLNEKPCYLNDPDLVEEIKKASEEVSLRQRAASLDEGIKTGKNSIVPVELLGFKKVDHKYESYRVSLDDVLKSTEPTLFLGNFGQGKSIAAIELVDKLSSDEKYVSEKYVPVFLTGRDITDKLHNNMRGNKDENKSTILRVLNGKVESLPEGVKSLPLSLRNEYKFVLIIDALDEIHHYRDAVLQVARDELKDYKKVIITSRFSGFNEHENSGFVTLHLDPNAVIRNMDAYLLSRISDSSAGRFNAFKEFLMRQDDAVKTNYLLVHFLTDLYNHKSEKLGNLDRNLTEGEILIEGIKAALWDSKLPKRPDMMPKPDLSASKSDWESYNSVREKTVSEWMGFLQRVAAYMTIHNKSTISRKEMEEVLDKNWTISGYLSKKG